MAGIPLVETEPASEFKDKKACDLMSSPVVSFKLTENVKTIHDILRTTTHHGFPVLNDDEKFMGIILRS